MPRYRKLYVKTTESLDINDMPDDFTRLLWLQLPLALCREGRGLHNSRWVQSRIFPLRTDVTMEMIDTAFDWFIARDMVRPYSINGRDYFYVPTFHKYQGNTRKEAPSEYPPPDDSTPELVQINSGVSPEQGKPKSPQIHTASASASTCESESESSSDQIESEQESALDAYVKMRGGAVNPLDPDQIYDLVDEFEKHRLSLPRGSPGTEYDGEQWVKTAIWEANAARNDRLPSLNYIKAILDRWRIQGFQAKRGNATSEKTPDGRTVIKVQP